jgi:3',5'-nucleoside bisphosphate phosphatase
VSSAASAGLPSNARFDLHMHSLRSDGRQEPEAMAALAAKAGLDVIAITDHDCEPSLPWGPTPMAGRSMHIVHAAELSGMHQGQELHLLVYFPAEMPLQFRRLLRSLCLARVERYEQACLAFGVEGLPPPDEAARAGERALTRTHLAQALIDAGHAKDHAEAYGRFAGSKAGRVPEVGPSFLALIRMARAVGGLTSWAHPPAEQVALHLGAFVKAGLQGIETARPKLPGPERAGLQKLAHRHGLIQTGGSDHHGWPGQRPLGQWSFPMREARPFARALKLAA